MLHHIRVYRVISSRSLLDPTEAAPLMFTQLLRVHHKIALSIAEVPSAFMAIPQTSPPPPPHMHISRLSIIICSPWLL